MQFTENKTDLRIIMHECIVLLHSPKAEVKCSLIMQEGGGALGIHLEAKGAPA